MTTLHDGRLQGRRPVPGRLGAQGDAPRRGRDARPHGAARRVRRQPAAGRSPHHGLAAHDHPDGGAHRDADRPRRRRALGVVQHLLDAGPGGRGGRRRPERHGRRPVGHPRLRLEGRDARGVLVVHRPGPALARRRRPQHDPRRRRRRHAARAQGRRVREGRVRPRRHRGRPRGVARHHRHPRAHDRRAAGSLDGHGVEHQGRHRGDHDRRPPPLPDVRERHARLPGHQRERLGHQVEVRQPLRLPAQPHRRHQPGRPT